MCRNIDTHHTECGHNTAFERQLCANPNRADGGCRPLYRHHHGLCYACYLLANPNARGHVADGPQPHTLTTHDYFQLTAADCHISDTRGGPAHTQTTQSHRHVQSSASAYCREFFARLDPIASTEVERHHDELDDDAAAAAHATRGRSRHQAQHPIPSDDRSQSGSRTMSDASRSGCPSTPPTGLCHLSEAPNPNGNGRMTRIMGVLHLLPGSRVGFVAKAFDYAAGLWYSTSGKNPSENKAENDDSPADSYDEGWVAVHSDDGYECDEAIDAANAMEGERARVRKLREEGMPTSR